MPSNSPGTTSIATSIADGALSIAKVSGLQSALDGKQATISDLSTIRSNASLGATAYGWGNHANAGYASASTLAADEVIIDKALQSLQSQIDSVSARNNYDELTATTLYSDIVSVGSMFALGGNLLTWDEDNSAWHLNGNFYADGFISAGGASSGSGSSGIDALAMWKLLTNNTSLASYDNNTKIAAAHIPLATTGTVGGIQVGYTSSGKNYAVQLSGNNAYVNVPWTDTTYSSLSAVSGGTAVSLVTTGEKYSWNNPTLSIAANTGTSALTLAHGSTRISS